MAQEDQDLVRSLIRSIDKRLDWEAIHTQDQGMRVTLRTPGSEAAMDVTRNEIHAALDGAIARTRLRERIKRCRQRMLHPGKPYMPWRLPKIEPIRLRTGL